MKKAKTTICVLIILCAFAASAAIIRAGNVLDIVVQGHPEFSGSFKVTETGTIDYPLLADEIVTNITTAELMNDLTLKLAKHIDNPLVVIAIVERPPMIVYVLGQVKVPGPVKTYEGATLQEVLMGAGGPLETATLERIKIVHKNSSEETAEYFNLKDFMSNGSLSALPKLKPDDTIILLAEEKSNKVKVIGAVNKPGFFDLTEKMNLFEVIYLAGGPAEHGDLSKVRRFSLVNGKNMEEVINVQSYLDKGEMGNIPQVAPGDIIIVYARWYDWKTILSVLSNVLLFIVTIQAFGGVFK
jgi:protein involved in polysaccharide export with SLBB domain